jgi:hypothetical protein
MINALWRFTMMAKRFFCGFLLFCSGWLSGQTVLSPQDASPKNLMDSLALLGEQMMMAPTEEARRDHQQTFDSLLVSMLYENDAWTLDFRKVRNLSVLQDPDKQFQIITYLLPLKGGRNRYYGHLILRDEGDAWEVITLRDKSDDIGMPDYEVGDASKWYGAIYYEIIPVKKDKQTYFTLIGFRPNQNATNEKLLEILWFQDGAPIFGHDLFYLETFNDRKFFKAPRRLIMKYKGDVSAMMKYERKRKRILMDHVLPPDAKLKGIYDQYGPDFTYNALLWGKNGWEIQFDVKIYSDIDLPVSKPRKQKKR